MTWHEAQLSLQVQVEERVGWLVRDQQRKRKQAEDAAWSALTNGPR